MAPLILQEEHTTATRKKITLYSSPSPSQSYRSTTILFGVVKNVGFSKKRYFVPFVSLLTSYH
jgi:hypothetical protein